jgi:PhnB protein
MKQQKKLPDGPPFGLTSILVVRNANDAAVFYKRAFDAAEIARIHAPDGKKLMHIRLQVFDSIFILMDQFPELSGKDSRFRSPEDLNGTSVTLHMQVTNAQTAWKQAITAGAIALVPMEKQFWGEYYGRLKDPFGHEWTFAQMIEHLSDEQVENAAKDFLRS